MGLDLFAFIDVDPDTGDRLDHDEHQYDMLSVRYSGQHLADISNPITDEYLGMYWRRDWYLLNWAQRCGYSGGRNAPNPGWTTIDRMDLDDLEEELRMDRPDSMKYETEYEKGTEEYRLAGVYDHAENYYEFREWARKQLDQGNKVIMGWWF